ncbi:hypothetical protein Tco_0676653 [Tanacetum coccineum]
MPQKEETFQVVIDFWYIIKKVQGTDSYEFLLANKKCRVDAEVFRKILDIYPRVEGEEFTKLQNDDDTLTFLIDLSYKGLLHKYTNMYVDHMSQPWRTLAAIINKCLSGKTASNDRLRKSRIDIIYHQSLPQTTQVSLQPQISTLSYNQEYGLVIPYVMLNDAMKKLESYQMFIKYSTSQILPKKSRGKESKPKPELVKKKNAIRRVVKKKVTIFADENIIPDPDVALELGKSISLVEAEEEEAAKQVHATHSRIVTESVPESAKKKTGSRSSRSVVIQDCNNPEFHNAYDDRVFDVIIIILRIFVSERRHLKFYLS